jgi:hemerythrin-like domain-containing protein
MRATDILRHEHESILEVLDLLEAHAGQIRAGEALNREFADWSLGFLRQFADQQHHGKEERVLFPALERRGIPREAGPIAIMLAEHDQGRAAIRRMAEAGARSEALAYALAAADYAALLRQHIAKENQVLFAMADQMLSAEDDANALQAFGRVVHETGGVLVRERYLPGIDRWSQFFDQDAR